MSKPRVAACHEDSTSFRSLEARNEGACAELDEEGEQQAHGPKRAKEQAENVVEMPGQVVHNGQMEDVIDGIQPEEEEEGDRGTGEWGMGVVRRATHRASGQHEG